MMINLRLSQGGAGETGYILKGCVISRLALQFFSYIGLVCLVTTTKTKLHEMTLFYKG